MHMVRLDIHLNNLDFLLLGKRPDTVAYFMADVPGQDTMTILGNPYNMVLAVPDGV